MKKTLTVNLNGIVFHIDDDAYQMLNTYISEVTQHLGDGDEVSEIIADIEARIAEVFAEKLASQSIEVVNLAMVREIIAMLGRPSDYSDTEPQTETAHTEKKRKKIRRFYRDADNAILGGVMAGLAAYLGIDAIILRVLLVVFTVLVWWALTPLYLLVWLIAPVAKTKAQQLEMRGEAVTVENIKNVFDSEDVKSNGREIRDRATNVVKWIFRTCFTIIAIFFGFVGFILFMVFFAVLLAVLIGGSAAIGSFFVMPNIAIVTSFLLCILCPIIVLVNYLFKRFRKKGRPSLAFIFSFLSIWTISLVVFVFFSVTNVDSLRTVFSESPFCLPQNSTFHWSVNSPLTRQSGVHISTKKPILTKKYLVDKFHAIDIYGDVDVKFTQSDTYSFKTRGVESILDAVEYEFHDGVLHITCNHAHNGEGIEVLLSAPKLNDITATGSCSVESKGVIIQDDLTMNLSGSSNVDLDLLIDNNLVVNSKGASNIDLEGSGKHLQLDISGSSTVDADELQLLCADVRLSGASKAEIWAVEKLSLELSGASKLNYKGTPTIIRQEVSEASSLIKE